MSKGVKRICPICNKEYTDVPALSRLDNTTEICPTCGNRQPLELLGMSEEQIQSILKKIEEIKKNG